LDLPPQQRRSCRPWPSPPPPDSPPAPGRYVTDRAGVLDAARSDALNARLAAFDRDISNQVVVWVDKSLPPGQDVETFARQAFNAWGIGRNDNNDGVLGCELIGDCGTRTSVRCWVVGV